MKLTVAQGVLLPASLVAGALVSTCLSAATPAAGGGQETALFREAAAETGLDFTHFIGATGDFFLPEIMGSGVAVFDYDGDGDLDVYLLQGALLDPQKTFADCLFPPSQSGPPGNKLFRNLLAEQGRLRFEDVSARAGVRNFGYGTGAAVGDYDNDGDLDLYVTNFGSNALYRNNGNGTFTDITLSAEVDDVRWSSSASFLDYDLDGDLDLFVVNYVDFTVRSNRKCLRPIGRLDYCAPSTYRPLPDRLFRNEGRGRFADVTGTSGIGMTFGPGLGAVTADFNADGWIDIYVANDLAANQLWLNKKDGTFEEVGLMSGTAYNADGVAEGSMGVAAGDFDNNGNEDLFMTHLTQENHLLLVNDGAGNFHDATVTTGIASIPNTTGFGTEWFDYDNDGRLDLFIANGAVYIISSLRHERYPYHQINQLFWNQADGKFKETTAAGGPALQLSEVSRGAAFGDVDNDGDIDIVVSNNNGRARLLLNQASSSQHWLQVRAEGIQCNRSAIGARVAVFREGGKPLWRRVHSDGSYLSASDLRVHFGLGRTLRLEAVVVQWPGGRGEVWENVGVDQTITLRQGSGKPWPKSSP